jgi:hypothetical protein
VKSEASTNSAEVLKAAQGKVKDLQSVLTERKAEIQRILIKNHNSSVENQVVRSSRKTVTAAAQSSENTATHSIQPTEAAEEIRSLEDELWNKRKYVTELKNKLTCQRLRRNEDMRER